MTVVVGLLDWCGPTPPDCKVVSSSPIADYGLAHVKTITDNGGDGLIGWCSKVQGPPVAELAAMIQEFQVPMWSRDFIELRAHSLFGRHFPDVPGVAAERPAALERGGADGKLETLD
ncbi:hypothetical protein [Cellulomonas dongxiuzhuiae]|uniref:Uncharacterized protein n=1 Tax=Cellulomonas dongxiuzhuiae TaxID=2819979 RepID=A0ABX8GI82_9CELL|nr:hypothetical protein [Cellulomonas dongxiuzhuiae]MBO3089329.1 hypothetical protein [Cellulomonas dongxiuzhuiae]MBO3094885.1 hypothetical protein [Cellulomonas dongxiuzhuiae]QWC15914.1 hypothetical protein KKR89_16940 [Cellulomonas dongxiuzhuiae]